MGANIQIVFTKGLGQLKAELFRNGVNIACQKITISGTLPIPAAMPGDIISIDGICTGTASMTIDLQTSPVTPVTYEAGSFFGNFIVL